MARDDFTVRTKNILALRAGHMCSNPDCRDPTVVPHSDPSKWVILGDAAHICAASPGGPRYDATQSADERKSVHNGIWLCKKCAARIDRDTGPHTKETLIGWKSRHESWVDGKSILPQWPLIELSTRQGLSVPMDRPARITGADCALYREHGLTIENMDDRPLLELHARV